MQTTRAWIWIAAAATMSLGLWFGAAHAQDGRPQDKETWRRPVPLADAITAATSLEEGFRNPPRAASAVPLWSWNGRLEQQELRRQIDEMVDQGVYGGFMHARAGIEADTTPYFSDGWWEAVRASVEHGRETSFATWLYDEDKWPSGAAGGRTIERNPERNHQKGLNRKELRLHGPSEASLPFPGAIHVVAGKLIDKNTLDPGSLVEVTSAADTSPPPPADKQDQTGGAAGKTWSCPEGDWLVIGYTPAPLKGVNYLNHQTVRDFIDITHETYAKRVGQDFAGTIPGIFFDEIMNHGAQIVWVEGFREQFSRVKGYDLVSVLPALSHDVGPRTPKIRCDYFDVYAALHEDAWFKQLADWCDDHKLMLTGHTIEELNAHVTQGDYFRTMRHLHIPATDNEDFRYRYPRVIDPWKPKQMASLCHTYGKPLVGVEAMGGAGWSFTLDSARYGFNMLAAYGVNFFIPHLFHYAQDKPINVDDWPNSWFFRNPYWKYFKTFADHSSRLTYMLTGDEHTVDVAVLYPQTNLWAGYGGGTTGQTIGRLVSAQTDADVIDSDSLLRAEIVDKTLTIEKMRYRVLVIPGVRCLRQAEVAKIVAFLRVGGAVIVHDRWPSDSMDIGRDDPQVQTLQQEAETRGIALSSVADTPKILADLIDRDVLITQGDASPLRYHHIRRAGREVYWLVNSERTPGTWKISFRTQGEASIWQPEDGSIAPVTIFTQKEGRTELPVSLDGWQGCFVVFDPERKTSNVGVEILDTNLRDIAAQQKPDGNIAFTGLLGQQEDPLASVTATVHGPGRRSSLMLSRPVENTPPPIALDGLWSFLPVGDALDHDWQVEVQEAELTLPVMHVRWEREQKCGPIGEPLEGNEPSMPDGGWRQVKILDTLHPQAGADRYRSRWLGRFISYYHDREFAAPIGGKGLQCRKKLDLIGEPRPGSWLAVVCESPFTVNVNDVRQSGKGSKEPQRFELAALHEGENTLTIEAESNTRAILVEGMVLFSSLGCQNLLSDNTWEVRIDGKDWQPAWEYVAPPEKPCGEPAYPEPTPDPQVIWYRQPLPPATVAVAEPHIDGKFAAWMHQQPLRFVDGWAAIPEGMAGGTLVLRVEAPPGKCGLIEPIRIRCKPVKLPLQSWTKQDLDWYSGRAIYGKTFELDDAYLKDDVQLELDLGEVCWCAEIWLNGKLVGTRIWPPYRVDITKHVRAGENRLDIVVANLLANRMKWDIFDDVKGEQLNRKWHDGNLRRDEWSFRSGLIGPVRIEPLRRVMLEAGRN